jgi:hypothetical protein
MSLSSIVFAAWAATMTLVIFAMRKNDPQKNRRPALYPVTWTVVVGVPVTIVMLGGLL